MPFNRIRLPRRAKASIWASLWARFSTPRCENITL